MHAAPDSNIQLEWNIPLPGGAVAVAGKSAINLLNTQENLFYDFDTKQVNSEEIREMLLKDNVQLTEISDDNLFSFSDLNVQSHDMTDSIEKLAKITIDNMYQDDKSKNNT